MVGFTFQCWFKSPSINAEEEEHSQHIVKIMMSSYCIWKGPNMCYWSGYIFKEAIQCIWGFSITLSSYLSFCMCKRSHINTVPEKPEISIVHILHIACLIAQLICWAELWFGDWEAVSTCHDNLLYRFYFNKIKSKEVLVNMIFYIVAQTPLKYKTVKS